MPTIITWEKPVVCSVSLRSNRYGCVHICYNLIQAPHCKVGISPLAALATAVGFHAHVVVAAALQVGEGGGRCGGVHAVPLVMVFKFVLEGPSILRGVSGCPGNHCIGIIHGHVQRDGLCANGLSEGDVVNGYRELLTLSVTVVNPTEHQLARAGIFRTDGHIDMVPFGFIIFPKYRVIFIGAVIIYIYY